MAKWQYSSSYTPWLLYPRRNLTWCLLNRRPSEPQSRSGLLRVETNILSLQRIKAGRSVCSPSLSLLIFQSSSTSKITFSIIYLFIFGLFHDIISSEYISVSRIGMDQEGGSLGLICGSIEVFCESERVKSRRQVSRLPVRGLHSGLAEYEGVFFT